MSQNIQGPLEESLDALQRAIAKKNAMREADDMAGILGSYVWIAKEAEGLLRLLKPEKKPADGVPKQP